jgi:hypothetical protein
MGQGNSVRAMVCCRQVTRCADPTLRAQARDLLEVLEAPALERPREWSLTLPELGETEPWRGRLQQIARTRRARQSPPRRRRRRWAPPAPPWALPSLVLCLLLLGLLLGGCVQVRAELHFGAPGRMQLVEELSPPPGHPPRLAAAVHRQPAAAGSAGRPRPRASHGCGWRARCNRPPTP